VGDHRQAPLHQVAGGIEERAVGAGLVLDLARDELAGEVRLEVGRSRVEDVLEALHERHRRRVEQLELLLQPHGEVGGRGERLAHAVEYRGSPGHGRAGYQRRVRASARISR